MESITIWRVCLLVSLSPSDIEWAMAKASKLCVANNLAIVCKLGTKTTRIVSLGSCGQRPLALMLRSGCLLACIKVILCGPKFGLSLSRDFNTLFRCRLLLIATAYNNLQMKLILAQPIGFAFANLFFFLLYIVLQVFSVKLHIGPLQATSDKRN